MCICATAELDIKIPTFGTNFVHSSLITLPIFGLLKKGAVQFSHLILINAFLIGKSKYLKLSGPNT